MNNREIAGLILLSALAIWGVTKHEGRDALVHLVRAFLDRRILLVTFGYAAYVGLIVFFAWKVGLWNQRLLIETVFWFVASGYPLMLSVTDAAKDRKYFRNAAKSVFGIGAAFIFFVNLATFSLIWEILLQIVLGMLVGMLILVDRDEERKRIRPVLTVLLGGVILLLTVNTVTDLYQQRHDLEWEQTARSLLLTFWLPLATVVFLIPLAYFVEYDSAFNWMKVGSPNMPPNFRDRLALIVALNIHLRNIQAFRPYWGTQVKTAKSFPAKVRAARQFRKHLRQREDEARLEQQRLHQCSGVVGADDQGRQLDRREFKETTDALRWVAICQMGHYRRRNGSYNPDIIAVLSDFTRYGLPNHHGITVRVSEDGQAWYGWRQTVSEWIFAIGAASAPSDEWLYDGPEPPFDFPSEQMGWDQWFSGTHSQNW